MDSSKVYLVQTDTTVGFSSSNDEKLSVIKQRPLNQKILQTVDSFKTLKSQTRIPKKYKKFIRKSQKTTFIYPNSFSYRVIDKNSCFYDFIKKFNSLYSTSANKTKLNFDLDFASSQCDIIVEKKVGFLENHSSSIFIVTKKRIKKLR